MTSMLFLAMKNVKIVLTNDGCLHVWVLVCLCILQVNYGYVPFIFILFCNAQEYKIIVFPLRVVGP